MPALMWLVYAVAAYVLWVGVFRWRYGFSPVVGRFPPRGMYAWVDAALGATLIAYSVWIVADRAREDAAISMRAGAAFWGAGVALRWWAIAALGRHWRIGQDERDEKAEFVATGPYRVMRHPINVALILVAIGQALMTGLDARALMLLGMSTAYFVVQGRAEDAAWKKRKAQGEGGNSKREGGESD